MILVSTRRADILATVAVNLARDGRVYDLNAIADSWRNASDAAFRRLSVISGMKPDMVLKGILVDELERRAKEES